MITRELSTICFLSKIYFDMTLKVKKIVIKIFLKKIVIKNIEKKRGNSITKNKQNRSTLLTPSVGLRHLHSGRTCCAGLLLLLVTFGDTTD